MTGDADARQDHEHHLFLADIYPELGEHLAAQCAAGYDTRAGRPGSLPGSPRTLKRRPLPKPGKSPSSPATTRTCPRLRCRSRAPPPRLRIT